LRLTPFFVRVRAQKPAVALRATTGCGRPGSVCHLRRRKNPPPSIINHQPSIINLSFPDSCPLRRRQSVTAVRGRCVTFGDSSVWKTPRADRGCPGKKP